MREMKDSGVEWIGEIPDKWQTRKLFYLLSLIGSGTTPKGDEYYTGIGIPWLNTGDLNDGYIYSTDKYVSENALNDYSALQVYKPGSIVIAMYGATIGKLGLTEIEITTNQACCVMNTTKEMDRKILFYILMTAKDYFIFLSYGAGQPNISQKTIKHLKIPFANICEQKKIANYLDTKCSKIDEIIEKQQAIIEKLKEYKLSVIIETVTKGLNPNVEMKDSGVEWIGQMPTSWDCTTVGMIATVVRGASPRPAGDPLYFNGNDVPWITVAEVTKGDGKYVDGTETFLTFEGAKQSRIVEEGTLLLSNSGATLGVPKITRIRGCINDGSVAFYNLSINQEFLLYLFKGRTFELRKQMQGYGQPNLNTTIVKGIEVPLPTELEQKTIVDFLDQKCTAIEKTIEDREKAIEKLREYKKSLIYEVVTGKKEV